MNELTRATVYIDGHVGTTGLRIRTWLADRPDLEIFTLSDRDRKLDAARRDAILNSHVTVLCLPNDAAVQAAEWAKEACGEFGRLIDASTAHRVAEGWTYGLPELNIDQRGRIYEARYVSNPGCYSSASVLLLRPLLDAGLIKSTAPVSIHALSGYSGGGTSLINKWECADNGLHDLPFEAPYSLATRHKHIPEIMAYAGLEYAPQFVPAVGPFKCGMRIEIPLHASVLKKGCDATTVADVLQSRYTNERFVKVRTETSNEGLVETSFDPRACNDTNRIDLTSIAHPDGHVLLVAILDNLGKGACGMAIQNINLMLGRDEHIGLPV